jgi:predicted lysophospholipase L1 biosynthesis ABC-type transport system permease subunit
MPSISNNVHRALPRHAVQQFVHDVPDMGPHRFDRVGRERLAQEMAQPMMRGRVHEGQLAPLGA